MTLCVVWKKGEAVHFAADSRLTVGENSTTDIAVKVHALPYRIFEPISDGTREKNLHAEGDIGICFAGSAISSMFIIETLAELMKQLQYVPGSSDTSMMGWRGTCISHISGYRSKRQVLRLALKLFQQWRSLDIAMLSVGFGFLFLRLICRTSHQWKRFCKAAVNSSTSEALMRRRELRDSPQNQMPIILVSCRR